MPETINTSDSNELREEFRRAKLLRDIKRELEKKGTDVSLDMVKAIVSEYQRLTVVQSSERETQEVVVDGDMVRSHLSGDPK